MGQTHSEYRTQHHARAIQQRNRVDRDWPLRSAWIIVHACVYNDGLTIKISFNKQVSEISLFIIELESDINATASVSESPQFVVWPEVSYILQY